jgi:hypothetical protein
MTCITSCIILTYMTKPRLKPGAVYRTSDLEQWSANPSRLAKRLVKEGKLKPLREHGLFACPKPTRFGDAPPRDETALKAFLKNTPFVFTGSQKWNALGLGTTAVFATPLVYNRKRSGTFELGGRKFELRRVAFPNDPPPEWYVIDLLENAARAGADPRDIAQALGRARNRFDQDQLQRMAKKFGTKKTQAAITQALAA